MAEAPPPLVSTQLRRLRRRAAVSLQELAARAGTSAAALHRYESGWSRFEIATLRRIARGLSAEVVVEIRPSNESSQPTATSDRELVELLAPLFWDKPLETGDLETARSWVLERVLTLGDRDQVRAARAFFGDDAIREAIGRRGVDRRTRNYWQTILEEQCIPRS